MRQNFHRALYLRNVLPFSAAETVIARAHFFSVHRSANRTMQFALRSRGYA